ncbi:MAG: FAD binding domain-containing protein [Burkholderiales bacterium]|nr:FAD binding domain-containing protein [Burkholderiales bacterium]
MMSFEIAEPQTLSEALALLDPEDPSVRAIAGGTALMLMMKSGVFRPTRLVSLRKLADAHTRIDARANGELAIGALTPLAALEDAPMVRSRAPVIAETLRTLSNVRVRNVATVGGHLAHADPHMDLPPVLIALRARVAVASRRGTREVAVEDLFAGYYETVLARDELISALIVPAQGERRAAYFKCTTRAADDWPALGVAVAVDGAGSAIREARIVLSAATSKPARLRAAEAILGEGTADAVLARAAEAAAEEADVMADGHGSAAYKRQLVRVYVQRALRRALGAPGVNERAQR